MPAGRQQLYPNEFRELLARAGDGNPLLPSAFFHCGPDGVPLPGKPDIRIVGGKSWVGILDQTGRNPLFDGAVGAATRIVAQHYGQPVTIQVEAPKFGANIDAEGGFSGGRGYFVRDMAIKRRGKGRRNMDDRELARRILLDGIGEIANRYGFDVPPESTLNLRIHDFRCIGLRLGTTRGVTNEYVSLVNAEITMNCDLSGIWQAGSLQSRGYGRIVPKIAGATMKLSAPQEVLS
ncbi:MAG: hypothetical protein HS122_19705 [Opitutaceae bacterium]|nr:hypothetical protein [Opitutaceae bacterium]